jgi:hypothetical protein
VNPNYRAAPAGEWRKRTQPLAKAGDIFTMTKSVENETWKKNEEAKTQQKTVDEVHV